MIYLKGNGSQGCARLINSYIKEMSLTGDSIFNTGEIFQEVKSADSVELDKKDGTKVIDFSIAHTLLENNVSDINRTDCYPVLKELAEEVSALNLDVDYCVVVPDLACNDAMSVRSKLINDMRIKSVGKIKIEKEDNFSNTHRSNPYLFKLNGRRVSILSLDTYITNKLRGSYG